MTQNFHTFRPIIFGTGGFFFSPSTAAPAQMDGRAGWNITGGMEDQGLEDVVVDVEMSE